MTVHTNSTILTMLTRFINSYCDHGGCPCRLSIPHTGQLTSSCLLYFSSLSSPTLFLFLPSTRWTTQPESESQDQNEQWGLARHHPTCLCNQFAVNYTRAATEGAPMEEAYQRRPTGSVTEEKRQRQNHAHHNPQFTRAQGVTRQI